MQQEIIFWKIIFNWIQCEWCSEKERIILVWLSTLCAEWRYSHKFRHSCNAFLNCKEQILDNIKQSKEEQLCFSWIYLHLNPRISAARNSWNYHYNWSLWKCELASSSHTPKPPITIGSQILQLYSVERYKQMEQTFQNKKRGDCMFSLHWCGRMEEI